MLKKVTENGKDVKHKCQKNIVIYDNAIFNHSGLWPSDTSKIEKKDTVIDVSWYLLKNLECIYYNPHGDRWTMKLNKNSNIIIAKFRIEFPKGVYSLYGTAPIKKILFRVIKFSFYEIILEDLETKPNHRFYYFQR